MADDGNGNGQYVSSGEKTSFHWTLYDAKDEELHCSCAFNAIKVLQKKQPKFGVLPQENF